MFGILSSIRIKGQWFLFEFFGSDKHIDNFEDQRKWKRRDSNNIAVSGTGTDSMLDSPTMGSQSDTGAGGEVSGNYATFNPVDMGNVSLSNGNLSANANIDDNVKGTLHIPEDVKIYFEFTVDQRGGGGSQSPIVGVCLNDLKMISNADSQQSKIWAYASTGNKIGGGSGYTSHGDSLSADDVLELLLIVQMEESGSLKTAHGKTAVIPLMAQTLMQHLQMYLLLEFFVSSMETITAHQELAH